VHEGLITRQGYEQLKVELERLENEGRIDIAQQIAKARAYGDLSENYEYQSAKEAQGQLEARIAQLKHRIKTATIVEAPEGEGNTVGLGHRVKLQDLNAKRELEYQVVGQAEANAAEGKISVQSPLGQGIFGHKVGETVTIKAPSGTLKFKILGIS